MEDYKKKYEEALDIARFKIEHVDCGDENCFNVDDIKELFSELKESEDEKIRKWVRKELEIKYVVDGKVNSIEADKALAWLEKQSEQKSVEWSKQDKIFLKEIIDFFENGTVKLQHDLSLYASWLKSLRPQSHWKPSEEQIKYLSKAIITLSEEGNCKTASVLQELRSELKQLKAL